MNVNRYHLSFNSRPIDNRFKMLKFVQNIEDELVPNSQKCMYVNMSLENIVKNYLIFFLIIINLVSFKVTNKAYSDLLFVTLSENM